VNALMAQDIIVAEKDGHLRTSMHFYNNEEDIDRFMSALQVV
jgi:selenocysteine lyase/cysteine desulfurase